MATLTVCTALWGCAPGRLFAESFEGFTEPYRVIDVAAAESGRIMTVHVRHGDHVEQGQILATLETEIQRALLAVAEKSKNAKGRLHAALAEQKMRNRRLDKFMKLRANGHARQEEVERARADAEIADANVLAAQEDLMIKTLEYKKILMEIERRTIRAPLAGFVTEILKEQGEYVPPTDPHVLTIVQLDKLFATFDVLSDFAENLAIGDQVSVQFGGRAIKANGTIEYLSPVIDAESGTIRIKLRVENPSGKLRSGTRCNLTLSTP